MVNGVDNKGLKENMDDADGDLEIDRVKGDGESMARIWREYGEGKFGLATNNLKKSP